MSRGAESSRAASRGSSPGVVVDAGPGCPLAGQLAVVWHFDQSGQRWRFYDPATPEYSELREMTPGQVYLVRVKATARAMLGGKVRQLA